jgi:uncharacterized membrane protein
MGITFVTMLIYPEGYIHFGVLHFISVGIIFTALLIRYPKILFAFIFISLILGVVFTGMSSESLIFAPLGIVSDNFYSIDYFPVFPWISLIFGGAFSARLFEHYKVLVNPKVLPRIKILEKVGQKSLIIYLVHQPILLGVIYLIF